MQLDKEAIIRVLHDPRFAAAERILSKNEDEREPILAKIR